jgi:hypothetical protein
MRYMYPWATPVAKSLLIPRNPSLIVAMRLVDALDLDPDTGLGADLIRHSVAGVGHDSRC